MKEVKINNKKTIAFILCLLTIISSILPTIAYAWVDTTGQKCSSKIGGYYESKDGDNYYFPDEYKVLIYDENGNTTVDEYLGRRRKEKKIYIGR